jgi:hypothetical protein
MGFMVRQHHGGTAPRGIAQLVTLASGALLFAGCSSSAPTPRQPTHVVPTTRKATATYTRISLPWFVVDRVSPTTLDVVVVSGGCDGFKRLSTTQSHTAVHVTAVGSRYARADVSCTADLGMTPVTLTLPHPQAGRSLVHAVVSSDWTEQPMRGVVRRLANNYSTSRPTKPPPGDPYDPHSHF